MLLNQANPYRPKLPDELELGWDDFEFTISDVNEHALGQTAAWTVVNYMAADCDLAPYLFDDLIEMKQVGSTLELHICAWFDGPLLTDAFFARLNRDSSLQDDLVIRYRELKTADPKTLTMALQVVSVYPARHRLLLVSGHGMGWKGVLLDQNLGAAYLTESGRMKLPGSGIECDARLQHCQRIAQDRLNQILEDTSASPRFDILAFDACDMGNIEAIVHFAMQADILVVSEDQVPGDGYPYAKVMAGLHMNLRQTPTELARELVLQTKRHYAATLSGQAVTQIALSSNGLPDFVQAFVRLVQVLSPLETVFQAVRYALEGAYAFGSYIYNEREDADIFVPNGNIDLIGFVQLLQEGAVPEMVHEAAKEVLARWDSIVIATAVPGGARGPNGLSIYAPQPTDFDPDYLYQINSLPWGLGIWSWFLASYYLKRLGENSGHPLLRTMQRTMQELMRSGQYEPGAR